MAGGGRASFLRRGRPFPAKGPRGPENALARAAGPLE